MTSFLGALLEYRKRGLWQREHHLQKYDVAWLPGLRQLERFNNSLFFLHPASCQLSPKDQCPCSFSVNYSIVDFIMVQPMINPPKTRATSSGRIRIL